MKKLKLEKSEIFQEQVVQEIIDACMCLEWPVLAKLCRLHILEKKNFEMQMQMFSHQFCLEKLWTVDVRKFDSWHVYAASV